MPRESGYVIGHADRTTLVQGPPGAILMLGGDRTAGSLDPGRLPELAGRYGLDLDRASVPRLAAAHGLRVPGAPPGAP
jgi:hypothetical protein